MYRAERQRKRGGILLRCGFLALPLLSSLPAAAGWHFTEVSQQAGLLYEHGLGVYPPHVTLLVSGGVAAGDVDGDGWTDLFVTRGGLGPTLLFANRGDGTFEEVGAAAGVAIAGEIAVGPTFADIDGDGWLDLILGGIFGASPRVFANRGDGTFEEVTASSGLFSTRETYSSAFGDYDRDGDLDLFFTHWSPFGGDIGAPHLWRNDGRGGFSPVDWTVEIAPLYQQIDWTFTANFADIDDDGWPDLLVTGDFGTSQVFRNRGPGAGGGPVTFEILTGPVISDENGMGAAVGDVDNDGDLDWFVASIWDPDGVAEGEWGVTGNRLYRNLGSGADGGAVFEDATEHAGVRRGYWAWGSCFADFDNDGWLDLFHTNGFQAAGAEDFFEDPARLFVNNRDGTFIERAGELGLADTGQGRGVVCFDYDRDGDIDLFVANNQGPPLLYRNDGGNAGRFLAVRLRGAGGNSEAIGARLTLRAAGLTQTREIRAGGNYLSQNPAQAHFGLADAALVEELRVRWPDGEEQTLTDLAVDRLLEIRQGESPAVEIPAFGPLGLLVTILALGTLALRRLRRGQVW